MRWLWSLVFLMALLTPATAYLQTATDPKASTIPEPPGVGLSARRVVVKLRAPLGSQGAPDSSGLAGVLRKYGTRLTPLFYPAPRNPDALKLYQSMGMDRLYIAMADSDIDTAQAALDFKADPNVEAAEPDAIGEGENIPLIPQPPLPLVEGWGEGLNGGPPNDPGYGQQWHLPKINSLGAWDISTGSPTITVAIIDTGIAGWHPDLRYRVWYNPREIPNNGIDDDGNGYVDDNWGWDFVNWDHMPQGDHWHGTHVAGIVGAEVNNGIGIAGLDQQAWLMAVKVLDANNRGNYTTWAQGVFYAVENGAQVLNLSLGGSVAGHLALQTAIDYAHSRGAIIVACMMNENSSTTFYPAGYANTIAVGATDRNDLRAAPFHWGGGSNFGSHIDVVAPGNLIYSTQLNDGYLSQSGTSMAAPQVAALAALIWSVAPGLTNQEVRQVIRQTAADRVGRAWEDLAGWDPYMGYGRIDAARALARARELAGPATPTPTPPPPTATPTVVIPPTATPTPMATSYPPPTTPSPGPTPLAGCAVPLINGGFDGRDGWTLSGRRALISATGHTGSSLFLGLLAGDTVENPDGDWASGRQTVTLPASFTRLDLSFWAYTGHTGGADPEDRFLARILNTQGSILVDIPLQVDSAAWQEYRVDLSQALAGQAGQPITVYFGVKNVAGAGGNAFMRVDDVTLTVCTLDVQGTPAPPAPTLMPPGPYRVYLPFVGSR